MTTKIANKSSGITTGMGILAYFVSLFEANELLSRKLRMSDTTIAKKVAREFPNRLSAQDFISEHPDKTVNSYRGRYNKGTFTRGTPPTVLSLRYNNYGLPVNYKTGTILLTERDETLLRETHDLFRNRTLEGITQCQVTHLGRYLRD